MFIVSWQASIIGHLSFTHPVVAYKNHSHKQLQLRTPFLHPGEIHLHVAELPLYAVLLDSRLQIDSAV